ncbi:hypothetical protein [Mycoplasma sp. 1012]
MRNLFLGKQPLDRKYLPKVIEHLYSFFSAIVFSVSLLSFILLITLNNKENISEKFSNLLLKTEFRLTIAAFVFVFFANVIYVIRLIRILPKTEVGHALVWIEITFLLFFVLSPLNIVVSIACLKYNEIVFE